MVLHDKLHDNQKFDLDIQVNLHEFILNVQKSFCFLDVQNQIIRIDISVYRDSGHGISVVLSWPMYTSMSLFTGCFLLNGIVQYVLVVCPTMIPESWNDKYVAWGSTMFVWASIILASMTMHCMGVIPPSYHALRGQQHDLTDHPAIILRRVIIITSFTFICFLRIAIKIRPNRAFHSFCKKFHLPSHCCCSRPVTGDIRADDTQSLYSSSDDEIIKSASSNLVLSNGTLFLWALFWIVGMTLRWVYGDDNLIIGDVCSISIFYVCPVVIVLTNSKIQRFLKRRTVFLYHRIMQDISSWMLAMKYICSLGCLKQGFQKQTQHDNEENAEHFDEWAVRTSDAEPGSIPSTDSFFVDCESNFDDAETNGDCVLESVE